MHRWNSIFIIDTCMWKWNYTPWLEKSHKESILSIRILWSSQNFEQEILTKRLKVIRQISKSNLSIPPVIVFRVPPLIAFVHQSVKQLESNANPRVHRIAQPVTSFPGCPEWSREIRCIIRAPGIRKIGLIVRRTGSTVFDDPIPRSDFHAHAVVRARYACIPSSTMPAIRYSRNEILCLFCAMKKKKGGRRERERELYLLISSLPGGTVNDWLLSSFVLLLFCFFLLLSFHFSLLLLFFFFLFIRGVESKIDKGRWLYV